MMSIILFAFLTVQNVLALMGKNTLNHLSAAVTTRVVVEVWLDLSGIQAIKKIKIVVPTFRQEYSIIN